MSTVEATSTKRIFHIRKQTFRKKITGTDEWTVNVEGHDQHGEQLHKWKMNSSYSIRKDYDWFLNLSGSALNGNLSYKRCYCQIDVFINRVKLTIRKGYMKGPMFNGFDFPNIFYLGYQRSYGFDKEIEIFLTIASCDENTFFEKQLAWLDEGILTDTIIKTNDAEFPCHKFVLASQSEYFKKMFQTDMKESQTNCVDWTEVFDASVVKDLLHFLYTGQKPPNIGDNHFGLLEAAHLCLLGDLKAMCVESIVPIISVENAAYVLQSAVIYESNTLQKAAMKFVAAHWDEVLASDFYKDLQPDITKRLFKSIFDMFRKNILDEGKENV